MRSELTRWQLRADVSRQPDVRSRSGRKHRGQGVARCTLVHFTELWPTFGKLRGGQTWALASAAAPSCDKFVSGGSPEMIGISGMRLFESFQLDDQTSHQGRVGSIGVRGWPAVFWSTLENFDLLSENYAGAKPGPSHRLQRHGVHRSIAPTAIECPPSSFFVFL